MKIFLYNIIVLTLVISSCSNKPIENIIAKSPEDLIEKYQQLEHEFNPSIATLYSDNAIIKNKRVYPDGQIKEMNLKAIDYKNLIIKSMPIAKYRNDTSSYTNIVYTKTQNRIKVTANRYSNLKKYTSPISWTLEQDKKSNWLIIEEISESRP
jgi:hypothetical protein